MLEMVHRHGLWTCRSPGLVYVFEWGALLLARDVGVPHVAAFLRTLDVVRDRLEPEPLRRGLKTLPTGGNRHEGILQIGGTAAGGSMLCMGSNKGACGLSRSNYFFSQKRLNDTGMRQNRQKDTYTQIHPETRQDTHRHIFAFQNVWSLYCDYGSFNRFMQNVGCIYLPLARLFLAWCGVGSCVPVSYTHLTLPTICSV